LTPGEMDRSSARHGHRGVNWGW